MRKCKGAKQFTVDTEGCYSPCEEFPNCDKCPTKLSSDGDSDRCVKCGAASKSLWEISEDKLKVPMVGRSDFDAVMGYSVSSVAQEKPQRFEDWTKRYGWMEAELASTQVSQVLRNPVTTCTLLLPFSFDFIIPTTIPIIVTRQLFSHTVDLLSPTCLSFVQLHQPPSFLS